jgi:ABC-type Fe3+ transport system permease subunit
LKISSFAIFFYWQSINMIVISLFLLGFIIFLVGYWFTSRAQAEAECNDPRIEAHRNPNYIGGVAGIVIGIVFVIVGLVLRSSDSIKQFDRGTFASSSYGSR